MAGISHTVLNKIFGDGLVMIISASVTATSNTITIPEMTTVNYVRAIVSGTEETDLAVTISTNTITTAGHNSGTESWILEVWGE